MASVENVLVMVGGYLALGGLVGLAFVSFGIGRVDEAGRGSSPMFRLLILPGCALLWPLVLAKWARRGKSR